MNIISTVSSFNKYVDALLGGDSCYDVTKKSVNARTHVAYMLNRTQSMFEYNGLPDTITRRNLELMLQTNGNVCWYKVGNDLYVFTGGMGGEPDAYYMPTIYTVANPALKLSTNLKIGIDCVVMPNDSLYLGLLPLFGRYAAGMSETELSLHIANINLRIMSLLSAPDDRTKAAAEKYLDDIADGKLGVIGENGFLDGVKAQPYADRGNGNALTNLIELEQYYKASWYNELGLNANYNMKRESLNSAESQLNNDALLPLVDNMLDCRKTALTQVNKMFGTNISVELSSSWKDNEIEIELEHKEISGQPENKEPETGEGGEVNDNDGNETE